MLYPGEVDLHYLFCLGSWTVVTGDSACLLSTVSGSAHTVRPML